MMIKNNNLNQIWSGLAVEELLRHEIDFFCISPGSRSTPLASAAAFNRRAQKIIAYDERGSGFYALGYGQALQKPAVIIVTSGTAVSNLFPSVVEAFLSKIPMIILTADRPPELQDTGANQTINQDNIFGRYVKWFFNMPCPDYAINPSFVLSNIDNAVKSSMSEPKGPVHLNFMFREPLAPLPHKQGDICKKYILEANSWAGKSAPYCSYTKTEKNCRHYPDDIILKTISGNNRGLISVGKLSSDSDRESLLKLIRILKWPVYADITSGLRLNKSAGTNIIKHFDTAILEPDFCLYAKPEAVIHFGNRITSKRFFEFFKLYSPEIFANVKNDNVRYNPEHLPVVTVESEINIFCDYLAGRIKDLKQKEDFKDFYEKKAEEAQRIIDINLGEDTELSEVFISRFLSRNLPDDSCLFLSNSMPVRDFELYAESTDLNIKVGSNRGASGIDGIIASSAGFAAGNRKICTLVIGDIAFIHDINSLSLIKKSGFPVIIILINNNGGGIFNFLPVSECSEIFKEYFIAPHNYRFSGAAENFKIKHNYAFTRDDFIKLFEDAGSNAQNEKESCIIEAVTNDEHDYRLRKKIKREIISILHI